MPTAVRLAAPPDVAAPDPTLDAALGRLRHRFGPAVAGRPEGAAPVAAVSTGSLALDLALGAGRGTAGPAHRGLRPRRGRQDQPGPVGHRPSSAGRRDRCFIDAEHALDLAWAGRVGVDVERLVPCRPEHGEQALEVADVLVGSGRWTCW
jgi:recombination protein RecA